MVGPGVQDDAAARAPGVAGGELASDRVAGMQPASGDLEAQLIARAEPGGVRQQRDMHLDDLTRCEAPGVAVCVHGLFGGAQLRVEVAKGGALPAHGDHVARVAERPLEGQLPPPAELPQPGEQMDVVAAVELEEESQRGRADQVEVIDDTPREGQSASLGCGTPPGRAPSAPSQ